VLSRIIKHSVSMVEPMPGMPNSKKQNTIPDNNFLDMAELLFKQIKKMA
jgi:hypothetical protein